MARPLHDYVYRNTGGESVAYERLPSLVRADEGILRIHRVDALRPLIGRDVDLLVEARQLAEFLEVVVHLLVADDWQCLVSREMGVLVLVKYATGDVVQVDGEGVRRLHGSDLDMVLLDIAATKVIHVRMAEPGEAAEHEHVPGPLQVGLALRDFVREKLLDLLYREEDDLLLSAGEFRAEKLEVGHVMVTEIPGPPQEPFQVSELLEGRIVRQALIRE